MNVCGDVRSSRKLDSVELFLRHFLCSINLIRRKEKRKTQTDSTHQCFIGNLCGTYLNQNCSLLEREKIFLSVVEVWKFLQLKTGSSYGCKSLE